MQPESPAEVNPQAFPALVRGLNTTDFWIAVFTLGALALAAFSQRLKAEEAAVLGTVIAVIIPALRTWLKVRHYTAAAEALHTVALQGSARRRAAIDAILATKFADEPAPEIVPAAPAADAGALAR